MEQDAKSSLNRPIPLLNRQPGTPQQVLNSDNSGSNENSGGGSSRQNPAPEPAAPVSDDQGRGTIRLMCAPQAREFSLLAAYQPST